MTKFKLLKKSVSFILVATSIFFYLNTHSYSSEKNKLLNVDWSFKGIFGMVVSNKEQQKKIIVNWKNNLITGCIFFKSS